MTKSKQIYSEQRTTQLINDRTFKAEIQKLREKWNIPPSGLRTDRQREKWEKDLAAESKAYVENPKFKKALDELEHKFTKASYHGYELEKRALYKEVPINSFSEDLLQLRKTCDLSDYWTVFVHSYLKFNEKANLPKHNTVIHIEVDSKTGEMRHYLQLWGQTTLDDIKNFWKHVKQHKTRLRGYKGKFRPSNPAILERNSYIVQLHEQGQSTRAIATKIDFDPRDFPSVSEATIRKIVSDF